MITVKNNNAFAIEITIEGDKYITTKEYNPVSDIIFQIKNGEDIVFGSSAMDYHVHIKTTDIVEVWKEENLIKEYPYFYEEAKKEIIMDMKKQINAFSVANYFSLQSFPEEMREKYMKRNLHADVKEKIENL